MAVRRPLLCATSSFGGVACQHFWNWDSRWIQPGIFSPSLTEICWAHLKAVEGGWLFEILKSSRSHIFLPLRMVWAKLPPIGWEEVFTMDPSIVSFLGGKSHYPHDSSQVSAILSHMGILNANLWAEPFYSLENLDYRLKGVLRWETAAWREAHARLTSRTRSSWRRLCASWQHWLCGENLHDVGLGT